MPIELTKPISLLFCLFIPIIWITLSRSSFKSQSRLNLILVGGTRSFIILMLGLALSDPRVPKTSDHVNLFFLLDVSESITHEGEEVAINLNNASLSINAFVQKIIKNTVTGMISVLKSVGVINKVKISIKR